VKAVERKWTRPGQLRPWKRISRKKKDLAFAFVPSVLTNASKSLQRKEVGMAAQYMSLKRNRRPDSALVARNLLA